MGRERFDNPSDGLLADSIVILPLERQVIFVGCKHRVVYAYDILVPAYHYNMPLMCFRCGSIRPWRLLDDPPEKTIPASDQARI